MTDQVLGPGDLAGPADRNIFLPIDQLVRIQIFAHQAAELAERVDDLLDLEEELAKEPSGGASVEEAGGEPQAEKEEAAHRLLKRLTDSFEALSAQGQAWIDDVHPNVVQSANQISRYAIRADRKYQVLVKALNGLNKSPQDAVLRKRIQRVCQRLIDQVEECLSATSTAASEWNDFSTKAQVALEEFNVVKQDLEEEYGAEQASLEKIDKDLRELERNLDKAKLRFEKEKLDAITLGVISPTIAPACLLSVATSFCILLVPAVVVVAGTGIASIALGADAAKVKKDIERLESRLATLEAGKAARLKLRTALRFAQSSAEGFAACAEVVAPQLENAGKSWNQLKVNLETLGSTAADDPDKAPMLFRTPELEAARVAWLELGNAADWYRVNAFVRVVQESNVNIVEDDASEASHGSSAARNADEQTSEAAAG